MKTCKVFTSESDGLVAQRVVRAANRYHQRARAVFNGRAMIANPGDRAGDVLLRFEGVKLPPFSIVSRSAWDKILCSNNIYADNSYGLAARWAHLMEKQLERGKRVEDVAQSTSRKVFGLGVSGAQFGCAVGILARVWKHGSQLSNWHDRN